MLFSPDTYNPCKQWKKYTYNNFKKDVINPIIGENKDMTQMFGVYVPFEKIELRDFSDNLQRTHGKCGIARKKVNMDTAYALVLDYDSGDTTMDTWIEKYSKYAWKCLMYTSFSHSVDTYKFRVVIPFIKHVKTEYIWSKEAKSVLVDFFDDVDISSFTAARFFYMPVHQQNNPYEYKIIQGRPLDFEDFFGKSIKAAHDKLEKEEKARIHLQQITNAAISELDWWVVPYKIQAENSVMPYDYMKKYTEEKLTGMCLGDRANGNGVHTELLKLYSDLRHNEISSGEIMNIFLPFAPDDKTRREMEAMARGCK